VVVVVTEAVEARKSRRESGGMEGSCSNPLEMARLGRGVYYAIAIHH
jgi:hypothetical protein